MTTKRELIGLLPVEKIVLGDVLIGDGDVFDLDVFVEHISVKPDLLHPGQSHYEIELTDGALLPFSAGESVDVLRAKEEEHACDDDCRSNGCPNRFVDKTREVTVTFIVDESDNEAHARRKVTNLLETLIGEGKPDDLGIDWRVEVTR